MGIIKLKSANTPKEEVTNTPEHENVQEQKNVRKQWDNPAILYEDESRVDEHSRHYVLNNGTAKTVVTAQASNFYDEDKKQWKEIDNTLVENGDVYENAKGKHKTQISKVGKGKSVKISNKDKSLAWDYIGKVSATGAKLATATENTTLSIKEEKNRAVYENIEKATDIEYSVHGNGVKENIVVREKSEDYRYAFKLKTQGLKLRLSENNESLELYSETTENNETKTKVEYTIPSPYMYDANGETTDEVYFELEGDDNDDYSFTVVASEDWINAEERAFPVTIDPQVVTSNANMILCTQYRKYISSSTETGWGVYQNESYYRVYSSTTRKDRIGVSVYKNAMNLLEQDIISAKVYFTPYTVTTAGIILANGKHVLVNSSLKKLAIDITSEFRASTGTVNFYLEPMSTVVDVFFYKTENEPYVEIEYLTNEKTRLTKKRFDLSGGVIGEYNVATGELESSFIDVPASDSVMGLQISHHYKKSNEDFGCGKNFRLNLHEKLEKYTDSALDANYVYTDANGDKHGFKDLYYYLDANGAKQYVEKTAVSIDLDGNLTYTDTAGNVHEIKKEQRTSTGLTASTKIESFKNAELIEQRIDEQKQIEDQHFAYKHAIENFVVFNTNTKEIRKDLIQVDYFGELSIEEIILSYSEALNYTIEITENTENTEQNTEDSELLNKKIEFLVDNRDYYNQQAQNYYKEYKNLEHQLAVYKRQLPVNYLTDGKIIKGFNEQGWLVAIYDNYENSATIEYDEKGKILRVYDGEEKQIIFNYTPENRIKSITDTRGRKTEYTYNTNNELNKVTFANGQYVTFEINENECTKISTSDEQTVECSYNEYCLSKIEYSSNVSKIANGTTVSGTLTGDNFEFAYATSKTTITSSNGNKEEYYINSAKNVSYYVEKFGNTLLKAEKYDFVPYEKDNVSSINKEYLYTTYYDTMETHYANGDFEKTVLNQFNNPSIKERSARVVNIDATDSTKQSTSGSLTTYTYDDNQKCTKEQTVVTVTLPTETKTYTQITNYNYNSSGDVVRKETYVVGEELTNGKTIEETIYDSKGNVIKSFTYNSLDTSSKFYTESDYAENGQVLADYDETGENKTEYEYITGTNVVRTEKLANGSKFAYGHDISDTVTAISHSTEEGEENSTQTRYTCGVVTELVSGNNKVNYEYDYKRNVTKVKLNGVDYITNENTYGTNNVVQSRYVPRANDNNLSDIFEVTKNKQGDILSVKYAQADKEATDITYSEVTNYTYDTKRRLTQITDKDGNVLQSNEYDSLDRQTKHTFGNNSIETKYDEYGQKYMDAVKLGSDTLTYLYSPTNDSKRELKTIMIDNYYENVERDFFGRSKKISQSLIGFALTKQFGYYKNGDHATNRVNTIFYGKNGNTDGKLTYTYDKMGNVISVNENGKQRYIYKYDNLSRLIFEKDLYKDSEICYTYDNQGNILTKTVNGNEKVYRYAEDTDRITYFGNETFAYDNMGNPTTYRNMTATWEKGRQLKSLTDGANTVNYTYDAFGLRTSKTVAGEITNYIYANGKLLRQTGNETIDFIYGQDGIMGIKVLDSSNVANRYLFRKNLFGDVTEIYSNSGELVGKYSYTAFGECTIELDTNGIASLNPIRYRGYYFDTETNLYYLKSRYYDPETGRFITIDDTSYLDPDTINGLNLYAYCGNNPVMRVDPDGNAWWHWLLGALLVVAVVAVTALTAGAAAYAVAGIAAFKSVAIGAAIGGAVAGGMEFITQGVTTNWGTPDFGALAIEAFTGALYGAAFAGLGSTTSVGLRLGMRGTIVATSVLNSTLHTINSRQYEDIAINALIALGSGLLLQGGMLGIDLYKGLLSSSILNLYVLDGAMFILKDKLILAGISIIKNINRNKFGWIKFLFA